MKNIYLLFQIFIYQNLFNLLVLSIFELTRSQPLKKLVIQYIILHLGGGVIFDRKKILGGEGGIVNGRQKKILGGVIFCVKKKFWG
jgi:hypothetical protein